MVKSKFGELRIDYSGFTCPVQKAVTIIGDKWTLFVLREFFYNKSKQGFNELQYNLKPISSRTLSKKLKKLVENKLLVKKILSNNPPKVEYSLTKKGLNLEHLLKEFGRWYKGYKPLSN